MCRDCKTDSMVNMCGKALCMDCPTHNKTIAVFGYIKGKPTHCAQHAAKDMRDVVNSECAHPNCNVHPTFGFSGGRATHCVMHQLDGMCDVVNKMCTICAAVTAHNPLYEGMCYGCFSSTYPDHQLVRVFKIKERHVVDAIRDGLGELLQERNIKCTLDRRVPDGCSARRPDIALDCGTHFVYVECDEHDHKTYKCEEKREMILLQDAGLPVIIIRFNPDGYTDKDGIKHPSCFTRRHATLELPLAPDAELWAPRRDALLAAVREAVETPPDKEFTRVCLFGTHKPTDALDEADYDEDEEQ